MIKTHTKFLIFIFLKSLLFVTGVIFSLACILNLITEIDFFKEIQINSYFPILLSIFNSPDLIFEMFPFIFLLTTQLFFINIFNENQFEIFKYSGLKNSSLIKILTLNSFFIGFLLYLFFIFFINLKKYILN